MVRKDIRPKETNLVSENRGLVRKSKKKQQFPKGKRSGKDRKEGRRMEEEWGTRGDGAGRRKRVRMGRQSDKAGMRHSGSGSAIDVCATSTCPGVSAACLGAGAALGEAQLHRQGSRGKGRPRMGWVGAAAGSLEPWQGWW